MTRITKDSTQRKDLEKEAYWLWQWQHNAKAGLDLRIGSPWTVSFFVSQNEAFFQKYIRKDHRSSDWPYHPGEHSLKSGFIFLEEDPFFLMKVFGGHKPQHDSLAFSCPAKTSPPQVVGVVG